MGKLRVDNHIAKQIDEIHYQTLSGNKLLFIGNEIRTVEGFNEGRSLSFIHQYYLKVDEIKQVFDLGDTSQAPHPNYELIIYIINSPFVIV